METVGSTGDIEESYKDSPSFLIDAIESMPDGLLVLSAPSDANSSPCIVYANRSFREITGYSEHELHGQFLTMLMGPNTEDSSLRRIVLMMGRLHGLHANLVIETRTNGQLLLDFNMSPFGNTPGDNVSFVAICRDITAHTDSIDILRQSEEQLRLALQGGDLGFWDWHVQTGDLVVNERWNTMLGLDKGFFPTIEDWHSLVHPEDRGKLDQLMVDVILNPAGNEFEVELRALSAAGDYIWILDKGAVVARAEDGSPVRVVGTHMDINSRRVAAKRLSLLQAEAMHGSRITVVGTMASGLAHELNQPLTAVTNYARAARRLAEAIPAEIPSGVKMRDIAGRIDVEAMRAGAIVTRLRDFISGVDRDLAMIPVKQLLADAVALFSDEISAGQKIEMVVEKDWGVYGDRQQLMQVLTNLVRNAIEVMVDIPVRDITITATQVNRGQIEIRVLDTGPGIPASVAETLFEPFKTTKSGGMGIGLAICRTIIEAHNGRIWVEPGPLGLGTQFCFTVPSG